MRIYRTGNWNKINTKEELIKLLKKNEGILNDSMIKYLNSLIDLEFSVVRDYINENDREALSNLEVYKRIAMFNIYHRALNLFKENELNLKLSGNNDGIEGLEVYAPLNKEKSKLLYEFDYGNHIEQSKIPIGYKTDRIGTISLFKTIEDAEKREQELDRVMKELERLYNQKNPYPSNPGYYGGPRPQWEMKHTSEIRAYEELFTKLDSKNSLTDEDKKEIEITNKFNKLLLEDYGLTNKDFEEEEKNFLYSGDHSKMEKTLVKKIPNIRIKNNIKYI